MSVWQGQQLRQTLAPPFLSEASRQVRYRRSGFYLRVDGGIHLGSLGAPTVRHVLAQCESVNIYGNCQSESSASEDTDPCVLINAVGACENRYQVEHPAHTMVK
ncbi:Uncharacterised protein [Mycobacteroides abscessus subsp. abscessus]|nr:Uncharacterised protein [Mycobacteroides abscessus subsp. abscessus]